MVVNSVPSDTEPLFTTPSNAPYQVQVQLNRKPIAMEIDNGSGMTLISKSLLCQLLPTLRV